MIIKCGKCGQISEAIEVSNLARYKCGKCHQVNEVVDITVKEWLGFDYSEFVQYILRVIAKDPFELLRAKNSDEVRLGKLTERQIEGVRGALKTGIENSQTIRQIRDSVAEVGISDLTVMKGDKIMRVIPSRFRNLNIARTETTRVSNLGAQNNYSDAGIEQYSWVASVGQRTCPICEELNGNIYDMNNGPLPPAHSLCRCTTIPVTKLQ